MDTFREQDNWIHTLKKCRRPGSGRGGNQKLRPKETSLGRSVVDSLTPTLSVLSKEPYFNSLQPNTFAYLYTCISSGQVRSVEPNEKTSGCPKTAGVTQIRFIRHGMGRSRQILKMATTHSTDKVVNTRNERRKGKKGLQQTQERGNGEE